VLATYWPKIWPGQERLAADMNITRRNVNRRLRDLEDAGLIVRLQRGNRSTLYRLDLRTIRDCVGSDTWDCDDSDLSTVTVATQEEKEGEMKLPDEDEIDF
jgi:DNA-binding transcriptional ArsR family regulator